MANGGTHILQHLASTLAFSDLGARHAVPDSHKLSVDVLHAGGARTAYGLLNLFLDEASSERPEGLVQKVVLRVSDGEFESIDFHDDALDFEHGSFILVGRDEVDGSLQPPSSISTFSTHRRRRKAHSKTFPTKNDIRQARISNLDSRLLPKVKSDIPHISLHLPERECKLVVLLVGDSGVWREFDKVMGFEGDDVREEVPP